ncbi:MAG: LysE/ArgO family amino acid transporter [Actinomycetales bacterium]
MIPAALSVALLGLGTGLALIVAIGAQNVFVLRTGIAGRHVRSVVLVCALSDVLLIGAGIAGLGPFVTAAPQAVTVLRWAGAAFLLCYALAAVRRAVHPRALTVPSGTAGALHRPGSDSGAGAHHAEPDFGAVAAAGCAELGAGIGRPRAGLRTDVLPAAVRPAAAGPDRGARGAVVAVLALTWLNPHVYLDTVLLLGSLANAQGGSLRWAFGAGAALGSVLWFTALGFGARLLRGFFARTASWRVLDSVIAVTMLALAAKLVTGH